MARFPYVGVMAVVLCCVMSCQTEQPTAPQLSDQYYNTEITLLDSTIIAEEGKLCPLACEIKVTDDSGRAVPEAVIVIEVTSGPGAVAPCWAYSDSSGKVKALYYLSVPYGDTAAVICAYAGAAPFEKQIFIHGDPLPTQIRFISQTDTVTHKPGRPVAVEIPVEVLDRRGKGVPDQEIWFQVARGVASVDPVARTDKSGRANARLRLHADWQGELVLKAELRLEGEKISLATRSYLAEWLASIGFLSAFVNRYYQPVKDGNTLVDSMIVRVSFSK